MRWAAVLSVALCLSAHGQPNTVNIEAWGGGPTVDVLQVGTGHALEFAIQGTTSATVRQTGDHHSAAITAINSGGPPSINLIQAGTVPQTVTIIQSCVTPAGCSVSVQQGQ